jgi:hypothetical protein
MFLKNWKRVFSLKKSSDAPDVVPEKLTETINYEIFFIIAAGLLAYQFYLYTFQNQDDPTLKLIVTIVTTSTALVASIAAFWISKRYWKSHVFGMSYLALAIGMLCNALAERIYYFLDQQGEVPSPSIADWVWLAFYPLTFYYLVKNIWFFKPTIRLPVKAFVILLPIIITGVYAFLDYGQEQSATTTFILGLAYIIGSSVILSTAILGAMIFRQGTLGTPWLIVTVGIALATLGDNLYSYVDVYNQYTYSHPLNLLWYGGYLVIAYALYKHKKAL